MEGIETGRDDLPQEHVLHIGGPMSSILTYSENYINSIVRSFRSSRELDTISLSSDDFRSACEKIKIIKGPFPIAGGKNATSVSENYETWEKNIEGYNEMSFWVKYCNDDDQATQDEELVGFYKKQDDGTFIWIKKDKEVLLMNYERYRAMKRSKEKGYQSVYPVFFVSTPDEKNGRFLPTCRQVGGLVLKKSVKTEEKPLEKPKEEKEKELIPAGV